MDHVVQVIERNGPNCEFAAVTAQAAPSPVVTLEKGINILAVSASLKPIPLSRMMMRAN